MEIKISDLSFSYGKNKPLVINNLNYEFHSNNCYILRGANGSGKTTLSKLICGLLKPLGGKIFIDNNDIAKMSTAKIAQRIGYLFQQPELQLFANTVIDEMTFVQSLYGQIDEFFIKKADNTLKQFGLFDMKERYPLTLSGGEKQRLALATIMLRDVNFLILDEPSSNIDIDGKKFIADFINNYVQNCGGVIVITHDDELQKMLNNTILLTLKEGRL